MDQRTPAFSGFLIFENLGECVRVVRIHRAILLQPYRPTSDLLNGGGFR